MSASPSARRYKAYRREPAAQAAFASTTAVAAIRVTFIRELPRVKKESVGASGFWVGSFASPKR